MRTSSAKAKGRRAAQRAKELLLKYAPELQDGDITVTPSGVTGPDLQLSPLAKTVYPFAIESKNQESLQIWAALAQAGDHVKGEEKPVLVFTRNHADIYAALRLEDLLFLVKGRCPSTDDTTT